MRRTAETAVGGTLGLLLGLTMLAETIVYIGFAGWLLVNGYLFGMILWILFGVIPLGLLFMILRLPLFGLAVLLERLAGSSSHGER